MSPTTAGFKDKTKTESCFCSSDQAGVDPLANTSHSQSNEQKAKSISGLTLRLEFYAGLLKKKRLIFVQFSESGVLQNKSMDCNKKTFQENLITMALLRF